MIPPGVEYVAETGFEHAGQCGVSRLYADHASVDAEVGGQLLGVGHRVLAGIARRHQHTVHMVGAQRVDRDGRGQR